jgi:response regulator of citrate/malate metabolism
VTAPGVIGTLIVDDDPAVLRLHASYLADVPGFRLVGTARSGALGAQLATSSDVDLVLLDMNLPDFSGVEVLHRLRLVREWDVDVIVISSARDSLTIRQAAAAHVTGYLAKPFTREAFVARLTDYRRQRAERPAEVPLTLGQGDIDRLVAPRFAGPQAPASLDAPQPLPKGIAASTLRLVLEAMDAVIPVTAREIAERSGASRATARRYLDYLVSRGDVDVSHRFGGRGRPEVLYRRATR